MNSFDGIKEDDKKSYPCDCGGDVTENKNGDWECNKCDFVKHPVKMVSKEYRIHVQFWKKSDTFECPNCHKRIIFPYDRCKCGAKTKVIVMRRINQ